LSKSLVLCLLRAVDPENPSVSKHTTFKDGSNAAQTPTVHAFCSEDVRNTSAPLKKHWFKVYDFPSPVFPNIDITLTGLVFLYPLRRFTNASTLDTYSNEYHEKKLNVY